MEYEVRHRDLDGIDERPVTTNAVWNNGGTTPSIADRFADLLAPLSNKRRRGVIARLSVGYYEGWHPTRAEVNELVTEELRRSPR